MDLPSEPVDFLIIGGGSAGCALASRLSEDPATRVLLAEAGRDVTPANMPSVLASAYPGRTYFQTEWLWPSLQASRGDSGTNQPTEPWFYERARILGGGSSINGICANRGSPFDYDEWAAKGARGWSWPEVLPYFKKLETDADFGEPLHGKSGPVPIQRHRRSDWTGFTRTMAKVFGDMGYAMQEDQNGTWADGVFPTTFNVDQQNRRGSAALVYLSAEVRRRPNLTVVTDMPVDRLVIKGGRVEAACFTQNGQSVTIAARQVIVSTGALQSPVVLMKSGIGPGAHLANMVSRCTRTGRASARICRSIRISASPAICIHRRDCRLARIIICRRCCAIPPASTAFRPVTCMSRSRHAAAGMRWRGGSARSVSG
jgi:5-(hydroxymethyl)furfural/furfural oxidase